ncbi:unnamed protein product [Periconia digitata]|uniref:Uncharacterized protein n=1 Tax=Periconia digitata TaxID=1303443 RepID=A0A9W4UF08_9PLEO|nr:unnamed protein product [Periconia digitata]
MISQKVDRHKKIHESFLLSALGKGATSKGATEAGDNPFDLCNASAPDLSLPSCDTKHTYKVAMIDGYFCD